MGLCDGLVRLFPVSYPAIVIIDCLVWIPSAILGRGQCRQSRKIGSETHVGRGNLDVPNVGLDDLSVIA